MLCEKLLQISWIDKKSDAVSSKSGFVVFVCFYVLPSWNPQQFTHFDTSAMH